MVKTLAESNVAASAIPRATFDHLASLECIRVADNVCLMGPAHREKSHIRTALGIAAVQDGHRFRYSTAADLVETHYCGVADNSVGRVIDSLLRDDLKLIDGLGFAPWTAPEPNCGSGSPPPARGGPWRPGRTGRSSPTDGPNAHPGGTLDLLLHLVTERDSDRVKQLEPRDEPPSRPPENSAEGWGLPVGHQRGMQLGHGCAVWPPKTPSINPARGRASAALRWAAATPWSSFATSGLSTITTRELSEVARNWIPKNSGAALWWRSDGTNLPTFVPSPMGYKVEECSHGKPSWQPRKAPRRSAQGRS